ncbi:MAG: hypothetical protein U0441_01190 [Polyangiaceae bacterium]
MKPLNGKAESSVKVTSKSVSGSSGGTEQQDMPTTVAEVMGEFTEEAIKKVSDTPTRERLIACHAFCSGVAEICLAPEDDKNARHLKEQLADVRITLSSVQKLVNSAVQLMKEVHDRDAKADAYHVAVAHVQENHGILGDQLDSYSLLVRGKIGKKHPELTRFGIRIPKGGRPTKKASSASASASAGAPGNAPASPVK